MPEVERDALKNLLQLIDASVEAVRAGDDLLARLDARRR
jgi:hypothetical protein